MDEKKKFDKEVHEAKEKIIENHQKIIDEEMINRDAISSKAKYLDGIIESDKRHFKAELLEKSERKNNDYNKLEKELEQALNDGDIDKINMISKKMKEV